jgi:hypothetical protein
MVGVSRSLIGVLPAAEAGRRARLFRALERVLPVRFEAHADGRLSGLDGIVVFDDGDRSTEQLERCDVPCLIITGSGPRAGEAPAASVDLSRSGRIDPTLRSRGFGPTDVPVGASLETRSADDILASSSGKPIWVWRPTDGAGLYLSAVAPAELDDGQSIRDYLRPQRFMSLLPLVHLLREVTADREWTPPRLRASIIIDDPNLHWPSYGYVDFQELGREARMHGYHAAMAIIPLDLWYFDPRAVRIFREFPAELSLVVHGNDHVRSELAQPRPEHEALELLSLALRRVTSFERRAGLRVERVMVPPHGDCSDTMFAALAAKGFDAISWSPKPRSSISGWDVADFGPGGLPSLPRSLLEDRDDLPFRAYLHQPLILEGHHTDLAEGLGLLHEAATDVNTLGSVTWTSPGEIARTNFALRRLDDRLHVRMFSRRVELAVPDGVERIVVDAPPYELQQDETVVVRRLGGEAPPTVAALAEELPVSTGTAEIRLVRAHAPGEPARPPVASPWPYFRRVLTEGRDRALPVTTALKHRVG